MIKITKGATRIVSLMLIAFWCMSIMVASQAIASPSGKEHRANGELAGRTAEIARDYVAGIPLKDILNKLVKGGAKVDEAVVAAVKAGIDPGQIVYTAVSAGFASQTVVTAALKAGVSLSAAVCAAIGAGADKKSVEADAAAIASPSAVANAITSCSAPGAPVFGYTAPADAPPSVNVPSAPPAVSGGATRPASPSRP